MTRYARAKGSKASNEKLPEDATSWSVMREQLLGKNKRVEDDEKYAEVKEQRLANYKQFLREKEEEETKKTKWADFPEMTKVVKDNKMSKKLPKQNSPSKVSNRSLEQSSIDTTVKFPNGKVKGKKMKTKNMKKSVEQSMIDTETGAWQVTTDEFLAKKANKSKKVKDNRSMKLATKTLNNDFSDDSSSNEEFTELKAKIDKVLEEQTNWSDDEPPEEESSKKAIEAPLVVKTKKVKVKKLKIDAQQKIGAQKEQDNHVTVHSHKEGLAEKDLKLMEKKRKRQHKENVKKLKKRKVTEVKEKKCLTEEDTKEKKDLSEEDLKKIQKKKEKKLRQLERRKLKKENLKTKKEQNVDDNKSKDGNNQTKTNLNQMTKQQLSKFDRNKKMVHGKEKPVRRKPQLPEKMMINGQEVEIGYVDGFPIKKDDAERLNRLHKEMVMKGLPKSEIKQALKLERRRAEKAFAREKKKVCFNCRNSGHNLSECPELGKDQMISTGGSGICFKCGSTEHTHLDCKVVKGHAFNYAQCFICNEQGHIARQCPDNPKGLYPKGGACKVCGDITHLKKDCPTYQDQQQKQSGTLKIGTLGVTNPDCLDDNEDSTIRVLRSNRPNKIIKF